MKKVLWLLRLVVLAFCFFDPARVNAAISTGSATVTVATSFNIGQANSTGLNPTLVGQSFNTGLAFTGIGAGANSFNEVYCAVGTISAASSVTLDLYGSLTDQLGNTINFARIKSITIELLTNTAASSITVGNAGSDPFLGPLGGTTPTENIANGGVWCNGRTDATGWAVNNSTAYNLKIANNDSGNVATYRVTLLGATS